MPTKIEHRIVVMKTDKKIGNKHIYNCSIREVYFDNDIPFGYGADGVSVCYNFDQNVMEPSNDLLAIKDNVIHRMNKEIDTLKSMKESFERNIIIVDGENIQEVKVFE